MNADIKYYSEKYYEMIVFLLFFFLPIDYFGLKTLLPRRLCLFLLILPRGTRNMHEHKRNLSLVSGPFRHHSSFTVGFACMSWFCHLAPETISEQNINPSLFPCFCVRRRLWALSTLLILHRWLYLHPDFAKWRQETCSADAVRKSDFIS